MNSYYIFIINDLNYVDVVYNSTTIVNVLLENSEWIFPNSNVCHIEKLKKGDIVLIYIAGQGNRYFYGKFCIAKAVAPIEKNKGEFYKYFSRKIEIENFEKAQRKILMKEFVSDLSFIKDKKNYGLYLRQAVKKISFEDYKLINFNIFS